MRDLVSVPKFLLRKKIAADLHTKFPQAFTILIIMLLGFSEN